MNKADAIKMFGCTLEALDEIAKDNIYVKLDGIEKGNTWLACSILSDAQHVMEHGDTETARQYINRAKHLLFALLDKETA
jgi:hypothetical protein